jgi:hypothetical protein
LDDFSPFGLLSNQVTAEIIKAFEDSLVSDSEAGGLILVR